MKTAPNCLYSSGFGSHSRLMWNNGQYLVFQHITDLFHGDQKFALHALPKLTLDHTALTYSNMNREGNYTPNDRNRMFLSSQTYKGFKITVNSHAEIIKFFLAEGCKYVLTKRLMQDLIEDYFGHQREKGRRSDNLTAQQFGYNDFTIASHLDIAPLTRSDDGGRYEKEKWLKVGEEPVPKRKRK